MGSIALVAIVVGIIVVFVRVQVPDMKLSD
jgi:hypothetical protein